MRSLANLKGQSKYLSFILREFITGINILINQIKYRMIYGHVKTPTRRFSRTNQNQSVRSGTSRQRSIPDVDKQSQKERQIQFPTVSPQEKSVQFKKFFGSFSQKVKNSESKNSNQFPIDPISPQHPFQRIINKHAVSSRTQNNQNVDFFDTGNKRNSMVKQKSSKEVRFVPQNKSQNPEGSPHMRSEKSQLINKKPGFQEVSNHDLWMIKDFQIDPRDHKLLIPFTQSLDLESEHVGEQAKDKIRKWLSSMFESVTSDAYYKYLRDQLSTEETKSYTSKNYILNIHRFMQKINQSQDKNKVYRDQAFSFINNQSRKIVKQLKVRYPQASLSGGSIRKFKKLISRPDNSESMKFDLLFAKKTQKINFKYNQSCDYMPEIMKTLNYLIGISSEGFNKQSGLFTKYEAFQHMITYIFKFSKFSDIFFNQKISSQGSSSLYTNYHAVKDYSDFWEKAEEFQKIFDEQVENGRKVNDVQFSIGKKIPDEVQLFTDQQIETGDITINHGSVLRTVTKWAEQLREKLKDPEQHIMNRVQFFKTKDGRLVELSKELKKLLADAARQEQKRISAIFSKMESHYVKLQQEIFNHDYQGIYLNAFDTNIGIISGRTEMCIGQYMVIYLNQLIHSMCRIPIIAVKKLSQSDPDKALIQSIDLITCKIGDLLRGKVKGKQNQIMSVYKFFQDLSEKLPQVLKIIKLKDRLEKKDKDVLMTFMFLGQVKCEVQLSISSHVDKKQKKNNQFNHFLYQLERAEFGPIAQAACIVAKYDPIAQKSFVDLSENSKLTQKCKRCLNEIYRQLSIMVGNKEEQNQQKKTIDQVQKYLPFFCEGCEKLIENRNPDFFQKRLHTDKYQQCNDCAGKRIIVAKQKKSALLALTGFSQSRKLSKAQSRQVQSGMKNPQYELLIELFRGNYEVESPQMQKILNHFRLEASPELNKLKQPGVTQFGIIFTKNNKRPVPMFYRTMFYEKRIHFLIASDKQKQKNRAKSILSINLEHSDKKKAAQLRDYYFLKAKGIEFQQNKCNNSINMKCNCCKMGQMHISEYFSTENIIYKDNIRHLNDVKRSQKETLYLADRTLTKQLYNFGEMKNIKRMFVNNCGLKDMKFLYGKRENQDPTKAESLKFQNIEYLNISNNLIPQILPIKNLKILKCAENGIKNIFSLGKNQTIQEIDISCNSLSSLKGIENLPALKILICHHNFITTFEHRSYKLERLQIHSNRLSSLKGVELFPNLKYLDCTQNLIEKINLTIDCPSIQTINLNKNKLTSLLGIQKLQDLKKLQCNYNQIPSFDKIIASEGKLVLLEQLSVINNAIQSLQGVEKFFHLKFLSCDGNKIQTLEVKKFSKTLEKLSIQDNNLKNLKGLEKYLSLKVFQCARNKVASLSLQNNDQQVKSLQTIYVSKIQQINIAGNILGSLKGVEQYPFLKKLQCSGNKISQMQIKRNVQCLQQLYLNRNQLKNLTGIEHCKSLCKLDCSNNPITYYGSFLKLQKLQQLDVGQVTHTVLKSLNQLRQVKSLKGFCKMAKQSKPFNKEFPQLAKFQEFTIHQLVSLPSAQTKKCQGCKKTVVAPYYWCKWDSQANSFRCRSCTQQREQWSYYAYKNNSVLLTGTFNTKVLEKRLGNNIQPQDHQKTEVPDFKCKNCEKKPTQKMARYICLCCKPEVDCTQPLQICETCMCSYLDGSDKRLKHQPNHPWVRVLFQVKRGPFNH